MSEERDYEAEAVEQGWNKDFDGPNKTDAKTFVERGEQIAGILKSKNKRLEERLHKLEDDNQKFGEYHKQTLEAQKKKTAEKIETLEAELAQAITDGDGQAFNLKTKQIDNLKSEPEAPTGAISKAEYELIANEWLSKNDWYNRESDGFNPKLETYADGLSERIANRGFTGKAYFSELTRQVKETFPEEFKNPAKKTAQSVETGGQVSTTDSKDHNYENLPADAKAACTDFVASGFMTKEDYVNQYEWE